MSPFNEPYSTKLNSHNLTTHPTVKIIARADHSVSRQEISEPALKVLYRLKNAGYQAYLVGGGVRDILLGLQPKDFDVATDALPEEAADQFRNSRLIGRRFRLLHVRFGREIIEVATFRGHHNIDENVETDISHDAHIEDGMIMRDNVYGDMEEDAWRRDFTINALYYNIADFSVVDYTGGLADLQARILRVIGEADQRYCEDPVRMLRAIRLAAKLDFVIHENTADPIKMLAHKLNAVPAARLFEEVLKLFMGGCALETFRLLRQYDLFQWLFPLTNASLERGDKVFLAFIEQGLKNTDERISQGKPVTPAFLFAIMLWKPLNERVDNIRNDSLSYTQAMQIAASEVISRQVETVSLPRRFSVQVREIWMMQSKLARRQGKRPFRLIEQARFRAGYDFLLLRNQAGEEHLQELSDWWTQFQVQNEGGQIEMIESLSSTTTTTTKRRRRTRSKKKTGSG